METILVSLFSVVMLIVCTLGMIGASLAAVNSLSDSSRRIEMQVSSIQSTAIESEYEGDDSGALVIAVTNTGQSSLSGFDEWNVLVQRPGAGITLLPGTTNGTPSENEWCVDGIELADGRPEVFDPGILDPDEKLILLVNLDPPMEAEDTARVTVATPNGVTTQCLVLK